MTPTPPFRDEFGAKWGTHPSLLIAYLGLILTVWGVYLFSKWAGYHNKYHDYRALAEGLRVQLFWKMAGIGESAADHYLSHQVNELEWIRAALKATELGAAPSSAGDMGLIKERWIRGQIKYFETAAKKNSRLAGRFWLAGTAALFVAVPWAALKVFAKSFYDLVVQGNEPWTLGRLAMSLLLVFLATMSTVALGLLGYSHFRGYADQARHYVAMLPLYRRADYLLEQQKAATGTHTRAIVFELGKEALAENAYWLTMHHQRKLDLPK